MFKNIAYLRCCWHCVDLRDRSLRDIQLLQFVVVGVSDIGVQLFDMNTNVMTNGYQELHSGIIPRVKSVDAQLYS